MGKRRKKAGQGKAKPKAIKAAIPKFKWLEAFRRELNEADEDWATVPLNQDHNSTDTYYAKFHDGVSRDIQNGTPLCDAIRLMGVNPDKWFKVAVQLVRAGANLDIKLPYPAKQASTSRGRAKKETQRMSLLALFLETRKKPTETIFDQLVDEVERLYFSSEATLDPTEATAFIWINHFCQHDTLEATLVVVDQLIHNGFKFRTASYCQAFLLLFVNLLDKLINVEPDWLNIVFELIEDPVLLIAHEPLPDFLTNPTHDWIHKATNETLNPSIGSTSRRKKKSIRVLEAFRMKILMMNDANELLDSLIDRIVRTLTNAEPRALDYDVLHCAITLDTHLEDSKASAILSNHLSTHGETLLSTNFTLRDNEPFTLHRYLSRFKPEFTHCIERSNPDERARKNNTKLKLETLILSFQDEAESDDAVQEKLTTFFATLTPEGCNYYLKTEVPITADFTQHKKLYFNLLSYFIARQAHCIASIQYLLTLVDPKDTQSCLDSVPTISPDGKTHRHTSALHFVVQLQEQPIELQAVARALLLWHTSHARPLPMTFETQSSPLLNALARGELAMARVLLEGGYRPTMHGTHPFRYSFTYNVLLSLPGSKLSNAMRLLSEFDTDLLNHPIASQEDITAPIDREHRPIQKRTRRINPLPRKVEHDPPNAFITTLDNYLTWLIQNTPTKFTSLSLVALKIHPGKLSELMAYRLDPHYSTREPQPDPNGSEYDDFSIETYQLEPHEVVRDFFAHLGALLSYFQRTMLGDISPEAVEHIDTNRRDLFITLCTRLATPLMVALIQQNETAVETLLTAGMLLRDSFIDRLYYQLLLIVAIKKQLSPNLILALMTSLESVLSDFTFLLPLIEHKNKRYQPVVAAIHQRQSRTSAANTSLLNADPLTDALNRAQGQPEILTDLLDDQSIDIDLETIFSLLDQTDNSTLLEKMMARVANPCAAHASGINILHRAIQQERRDCIAYLVNEYFDDLNVETPGGDWPVHLLEQRGLSHELITNTHPEELNKPNQKGETMTALIHKAQPTLYSENTDLFAAPGRAQKGKKVVPGEFSTDDSDCSSDDESKPSTFFAGRLSTEDDACKLHEIVGVNHYVLHSAALQIPDMTNTDIDTDALFKFNDDDFTGDIRTDALDWTAILTYNGEAHEHDVRHKLHPGGSLGDVRVAYAVVQSDDGRSPLFVPVVMGDHRYFAQAGRHITLDLDEWFDRALTPVI